MPRQQTSVNGNGDSESEPPSAITACGIAETLRVLRDKFGLQGYDVFDAGQRLRKLGMRN